MILELFYWFVKNLVYVNKEKWHGKVALLANEKMISNQNSLIDCAMTRL